jgi:hypothetical protein
MSIMRERERERERESKNRAKSALLEQIQGKVVIFFRALPHGESLTCGGRGVKRNGSAGQGIGVYPSKLENRQKT